LVPDRADDRGVNYCVDYSSYRDGQLEDEKIGTLNKEKSFDIYLDISLILTKEINNK